jgi:hypothetical protein
METAAQEQDGAERSHEFTVVVNGRKVETEHETLDFDQVVELSSLPTGPDIQFTISYRRGPHINPEGSMVEGGAPVKVKSGMIFNVDSTNRS